MRSRNTFLLLCLSALLILFAGSCAPAAAPTGQQSAQTAEVEAPPETEAPAAEEPAAPAEPAMTEAPAPQPTAALPTAAGAVQPESPGIETREPGLPTLKVETPAPLLSPTSAPTALPTLESPRAKEDDRIVQIEWPASLRLGESDTTRLMLVPVEQGYLLVAEYPEHQVVTQTVAVQPVSGYELFAVARLDGPGFDISPSGEQAQYLLPDTPLSWRWSLTPRQTGRHRVSVSLLMRWVPVASTGLAVREVVAYSRALDIRVISFLGLTQSQAMLTGLLGLLIGGGLCMFALVVRPKSLKSARDFEILPPNPGLAIELPPGILISPEARSLLQVLFERYARLVIEQEFLSGYSGARTFLALPVRKDGRSDAYTIAKLGEKGSILKEQRNYEDFVKDTLPPITARIQRSPVTIERDKSNLAALQYTFIGEPGQPPISLRNYLLRKPDPALIKKLMDTFGPNWWMQRRPYTFRLALEYDRVLPTHYVIEPDEGSAMDLDGRYSPGEFTYKPGDRVTLRNFKRAELRLDGVSQSLQGAPASGFPPLRVRWLSTQKPEGATGRVIATRRTLLRGFVEGCDLFGLPDPFLRLDDLLGETIQGTQSILHGDLNLENILVGPGNMLWLIDFAQTREGHTLFDFAHLGAELVAHIAAQDISDPHGYLQMLRTRQDPAGTGVLRLINGVEEIATSLLMNPNKPREFRLSFALACLGALKYINLSHHARHLLYLTGAALLNEDHNWPGG